MQTGIRWAFCILSIEVLFLVALQAGQLSAVPPLAASCVLLAANPQGMFAQPRTVIMAYMLVSHLGLLNSVFWGNDLFCYLVMTLVAVLLMVIVPCIHPPAIALPFLLANSTAPFRDYLIFMCMVGSIVLLHLASQWLLNQLYDTTNRSSPLLRNISNPESPRYIGIK